MLGLALPKQYNVEGVLVIKNPWPSIARTVYRDHKRYLETYMKVSIGWFLGLWSRFGFIGLFSHTLDSSTPETVLRGIKMGIFGLKVVLMVSITILSH